MVRNTLRLCWVESFLAVIDGDGVEARAAKAIGTDASTVNRDIGKLDAWLGWVTFYRDVPRELTPDGRNFEPTARQVMELLTAARRFPNTSPEPGPAPVSARVIKLRPSGAQ